MQRKADQASIRCPHCRSDNVRRHKWSGGGFAIPLFITGIPFLIPSKVHRCFECSRDFKLNGPSARGIEQRQRKGVVAIAVLVALALVLLLV
ncbi:MAG TPA: hypothetical protein VKG92_04495 [Flavobacteriales bacterium]|nr:hypothetical protein [Flavobacteriales bacterium]